MERMAHIFFHNLPHFPHFFVIIMKVSAIFQWNQNDDAQTVIDARRLYSLFVSFCVIVK